MLRSPSRRKASARPHAEGPQRPQRARRLAARASPSIPTTPRPLGAAWGRSGADRPRSSTAPKQSSHRSSTRYSNMPCKAAGGGGECYHIL
eukprot:scaffold158991_cov36-Tisochrysis_lutea.AAC.5